MHQGLQQWIENEGLEYTKQIPKITIQNGEVSTDVETPYIIRHPQTNQEVIIIDLSGTYTSLEDTEAMVLLTNSKVWGRQENRNEWRVYDLSGVELFTLDRDQAESWLRLFGNWFGLLAFPLMVAGSFAYRAVQALLYAAIGLGFAKRLKVKLSYQTLVRLSVIAITPAVVLSTIVTLFRLEIPLVTLFYFVIAMWYLYWGVQANRENGPFAAVDIA